ncbi:MAG: AzlD domain-containing protein [Syntrophomonadaceae bacterium]|jgi:branched-subunit amino acid transport protein
MDANSILLVILGTSAVTLIPRMLPVAMLSRFEFPEKVQLWLSFVAPAVLGALTALSVIAPQGSININPGNIYIWAFIPTLITAIKTKNLFYTLVAGIAAMAVLYNLVGM